MRRRILACHVSYEEEDTCSKTGHLLAIPYHERENI